MRDTEAATRTLNALKELGVRIAIDDFGTGYSSLAYLHQFPVDALKIDRSFISGNASRDSEVLVRTLMRLSANLGLQTLAEGIEEPEQLASLRRDPGVSGQGFLFAPPLEPDAVDELLACGGGRRRRRPERTRTVGERR